MQQTPGSFGWRRSSSEPGRRRLVQLTLVSVLVVAGGVIGIPPAGAASRGRRGCLAGGAGEALAGDALARHHTPWGGGRPRRPRPSGPRPPNPTSC